MAITPSSSFSIEHRYVQHRSSASHFGERHRRWVAFDISLLFPEIGNLLQLLRRGNPGKGIVRTEADHWVAPPQLVPCWRRTVHRRETPAPARRASLKSHPVPPKLQSAAAATRAAH